MGMKKYLLFRQQQLLLENLDNQFQLPNGLPADVGVETTDDIGFLRKTRY